MERGPYTDRKRPIYIYKEPYNVHTHEKSPIYNGKETYIHMKRALHTDIYKFEQICSRESLTEKAVEIEKTISVKEHKRKRHDFDPKMFYENGFWNRRLDGIVINKNHRTLYILEFKRTSDRNEDYLEQWGQ